jgi:hypothetical protein
MSHPDESSADKITIHCRGFQGREGNDGPEGNGRRKWSIGVTINGGPEQDITLVDPWHDNDYNIRLKSQSKGLLDDAVRRGPR